MKARIEAYTFLLTFVANAVIVFFLLDIAVNSNIPDSGQMIFAGVTSSSFMGIVGIYMFAKKAKEIHATFPPVEMGKREKVEEENMVGSHS